MISPTFANFSPISARALDHGGGSARDITSWLNHIHASCALPPLTITQGIADEQLPGTVQKENQATPQHLIGPTVSTHYELSVLPTRIKALILQGLAEMIGGHALPKTLRTFPCSATNPLQVSESKILTHLILTCAHYPSETHLTLQDRSRIHPRAQLA